MPTQELPLPKTREQAVAEARFLMETIKEAETLIQEAKKRMRQLRQFKLSYSYQDYTVEKKPV